MGSVYGLVCGVLEAVTTREQDTYTLEACSKVRDVFDMIVDPACVVGGSGDLFIAS